MRIYLYIYYIYLLYIYLLYIYIIYLFIILYNTNILTIQILRFFSRNICFFGKDFVYLHRDFK